MILVYSFVTYPDKEKLQELFPGIFFFRKLHIDFETFTQLISEKKPDVILGIANVRWKRAWFEAKAINRFNKTKKIIKNAAEEYKLYTPNVITKPFFILPTPATTFCNWTAFKINHYLHQNNIETKLVFSHLHQQYLPLLQDSLIN